MPLRHPILAILAAMLLLLALFIGLFIATFDLNHYREQLSGGLEKVLKHPVEVGEAHFSLDNGPAIELAGVRVASTGSATPLFLSNRLTATLDWRALLQGQVVLSALVLEGPQLNLDLTSDSPPPPSALSPPPPGGGESDVRLESVTIRNGRLQVKHPTTPLQLQRITGTVTDLEAGRPLHLELFAELMVDDRPVPATLQGTIHPTGPLQEWRKSRLELKLELDELPAEAVLRQTAPDLTADGSLALHLELEGSFADTLHFSGKAGGAKLALQRGGGDLPPVVFKELQTAGSWHAPSAELKLSSLRLELSELLLKGRLALAPRSRELWLKGRLERGVLGMDALKTLSPAGLLAQLPPALEEHLAGSTLILDETAFSAALPLPSGWKSAPPSSGSPEPGRPGTLHLEAEGRWETSGANQERAAMTFDLKELSVSPYVAERPYTLTLAGKLPATLAAAMILPGGPEGLAAEGALACELSLEGNRDRHGIDLGCDLSDVALNHPRGFSKPAGMATQLQGEVELTPERVDIQWLKLDLPPLQLSAVGKLQRQGPKRFDLELDLAETDLVKVATILQPLGRHPVRGTLSGSARLEGTKSGIGQISGELAIAEGAVPIPGPLADLSALEGTARFTRNRLEIDQLRGLLGSSPLTITGTMEGGETPRLDLRVQAEQVRARELIFPNEEYLLHELDGDLTITSLGIDFNQVRVRLNENTLATVRGRMEGFRRPHVILQIDSERADIDEVIRLFRRPSAAGESAKRTEEPKKEGKVTTRITVHAERGELSGMLFHNATGTIRSGPGWLAIHPLTFRAGPGFGRGRVALETTPEGETRLEISGHVEEMDAEILHRQLLEGRGLVTGRLRGDFYLEGRPGESFLSTSQGGVHFEIRDGVLRRFQVLSKVFSLLNVSQLFSFSLPDMSTEGMPFKGVEGTLALEGGTLSTEDLLVDSNAMNLSLVGKVDLIEKKLDYIMGVKPLGTVDSILTQIPVAGWLLAGEEKALVTAHFQVQGPAEAPQVRPIPVTSLSEKVIGIFRRTFSLPAKMITDPSEVIRPGQ